MSEIVDVVEPGIPGPMGDVTPAALQAAADAKASATQSATSASQSKVYRDEAEQFAAGTVALQDAAVASLVSTPGKLTRAAVEKVAKSHMYRVSEYGAVGNGTTDDTAAIQAAVDAAPAGAAVLFDAKRYNVAGLIHVKRSVFLFGYGATLLKKNALGASSAVIFALLGGTGTLHDVGVFGFGCEGDPGARGANLIWAHRVNRLTVVDVMAVDSVTAGHVIDLQGCTNVSISRSVFKGAKPTVGREYAEAIQIDHSIRQGSPEPEFPGQKYDGKACDNIAIEDCSFVANGSLKAPRSFGMHSTVQSRMHGKIVFKNNLVEEPTESTSNKGMVNVMSIEHLIITGNVFKLSAGKDFSAVIWYHKVSRWYPLAGVDTYPLESAAATSEMRGSRIGVYANEYPAGYDKAVNCFWRPTFEPGFKDYNATTQIRVYATEDGCEVQGAVSTATSAGLGPVAGVPAFYLPPWAFPKRKYSIYMYGSSGATWVLMFEIDGSVRISRYSNLTQNNPFLPAGGAHTVW